MRNLLLTLSNTSLTFPRQTLHGMEGFYFWENEETCLGRSTYPVRSCLRLGCSPQKDPASNSPSLQALGKDP